jgi:protoporphyrin/coproporphyrin ferrochelatase
MSEIPSREAFGVLLMAYGSPNSLEEVEPYYTDVRGGRPPTPQLLDALKARYARVGGHTPLLAISREQAAGLQARLNQETPGRYRVYLGMKHWHPFLEEPVRQMARDGIAEAVAMALAPHYSRMSIGGYIAKVEAAQAWLAEEGNRQPTQFTFVRSWHDEPHFWQALANRVQATLAARFAPTERTGVFVLFTAHSLPERILAEEDPYPRELLATSTGVAGLLGMARERWDFAFQSAGRTPEPWLGPDILTRIRGLAASGERAILICPVGFIADHLEILYDIDVECQDLAYELGVHVERIEMLNAGSELIEALAAVVRQHTPH